MKIKFIVFFIYICLFNLNKSFSQVNIESFREEAKKEGFYGSLKGGIQLQSGNVDLKVYDISSDLHVKKDIHHLLLKASYQKGYQGSELFQNNGFGHFRYTIMYHDFLGYEGFTQTEFDKFKSLELRQLIGTGIRTEFLFLEKLSINSGLGIMNDHEQLESKLTSTDTRVNSYFVAKYIINKKTSSFLSIILYYQPLLFTYKDFRIKNEANLKTFLGGIKTTKIYIISSFSYLYDSKPPEDIVTDDKILKISLSLDW